MPAWIQLMWRIFHKLNNIECAMCAVSVYFFSSSVAAAGASRFFHSSFMCNYENSDQTTSSTVWSVQFQTLLRSNDTFFLSSYQIYSFQASIQSIQRWHFHVFCNLFFIFDELVISSMLPTIGHIFVFAIKLSYDSG